MKKRIFEFVNNFEKKHPLLAKKLKPSWLVIKKFFFSQEKKIENKPVATSTSKNDLATLTKKIEKLSLDLEKCNQKFELIHNFLVDFSINFERDRHKDPFEEIKQSDRILVNSSGVRTLDNIFNEKVINNLKDTIDNRIEKADCLLLWGQFRSENTSKIIIDAFKSKKKLFFADEGLIRSILPTVPTKDFPDLYKDVFAYVFDYTTYFDAFGKSYFISKLNSDFEITTEEKCKANELMQIMLSNYITKYNHQPIFIPNQLRIDKKKVLIIDQSYKDFSIKRGAVTEDVFVRMLEDAKAENPEAEIIIKAHPDMILNKHRAGATGTLMHFNNADLSNVKLVTESVNPIALLSAVDKVYVCTSQMGFEALMLGKETIIYGAPFYAGWGNGVVRNDYLNKHPRNRNRSIIELFYFMYVIYTHYIDPDTYQPCSFDIYLQKMIKLRNDFFDKYRIRFDYDMKFPSNK